MLNNALETTVSPKFSVSEFNQVLNQHLKLLGDVQIEGEITQMTITRNKGVYIILKDTKENAVVSVSGYAPTIQGIDMVNEGMKVVVWGNPEIYSPMGKFSIKAFKIIPSGKGALKEAYERLKIKLESEGLFNEDRKRPLPEFITKIALLTGKDSAAQSDFLKILNENNANFSIDFYPVHVQGKHSESEIINTLRYISEKNYDCIVLTRGGGSLEDLITFNEEKVARTIFALNVPVIVGVGHEKDESIADFVADVRASTPSQAAYYLIAQNNGFLNSLEMQAEAIRQHLLSDVQKYRSYINNFQSKVDGRIKYEISTIINNCDKLLILASRFPTQISEYKERVDSYARLINSFNPKTILNQGYNILKSEGKLIKSVKDLKPKQSISLTLIDGSADATIDKINK